MRSIPFVIVFLLFLSSVIASSVPVITTTDSISVNVENNASPPPPPPPTPSGGGGGGGGGGGARCRTKYVCEAEWGACSDGNKLRTCSDENRCIRVNITQRIPCDTNLSNVTIAPPVEKEIIQPEEVPQQEPVPTQPEPQPVALKQEGESCVIPSGWPILDDSFVDSSCITSWCHDGWFQNTCQIKDVESNTSILSWFKKNATTTQPEETPEQKTAGKEVVFWIIVILLLLGYLFLRRKKQQQPSPEGIPELEILEVPPRLQRLYEGIVARLERGMDKYEIIDMAKRKGWQEDDLELVFGIIERRKRK